MWFLHILPPKAFMAISLGIMLSAPAIAGRQLDGVNGLVAGIALGFALVFLAIKHFLVFVEEKRARLIMNPLLSDGSGEAQIRTALSGWNAKYPWEHANDATDFSLEDIRIRFDVECPSKDGPAIKVTGGFTYTPDPKNLLQYYTSQKVVGEMALDKVRSFISASIATQSAVEVRNSMKELSGKVTHYFSVGDNATKEEEEGTKVVTDLEKRYGIVFKKLTVADVTFADKFQNARTSRAVMQTLEDAANELQEKTGVSGQAALDAALIVNGDVKKTVAETVARIEGSGADAAFAFLRSLFTGTSPAPGKDAS